MAADGDDGNLGGQVSCDGGLKCVALGNKEAVEVGPGVVAWQFIILLEAAGLAVQGTSAPGNWEAFYQYMNRLFRNSVLDTYLGVSVRTASGDSFTLASGVQDVTEKQKPPQMMAAPPG